MTDVPMTNILEQCDFKSVLTLRKVCHGVRNFIDDANFKTELTVLQITINSIDFSFRSYSKNGPAGAAEHCTLDDLKIILGIQNSTLLTFSVVIHPKNIGALDDLKDILKNKPRPLQTENVEIRVSRGSQVLKILPYLDSKVLKRITLMTPVCVRDTNLDEIERIMELEQFKIASELTINGFSVDVDLKKFFHFEKICIKFQEIPIMDLVALKEVFTTSPHMEKFWLHHYIMDNNQFEKKFGVPSKETEREDDFVSFIYKKWYFKMQTSKDDVLEIVYASFGLLSFKRIRAADVEENVIVRD
ncbi:hypothetical protein CAEBREN_05719 [Caenorhabditis brenneri]|uniref:F-box domain-containing protein n=1 Tax=Caenorhabditis brenneri TaxID=135651 RepID=G0N1H6_CAEBE|nr:hypothetical protein CAEBREN_05719 [Caenorhabditis brenneri]